MQVELDENMVLHIRKKAAEKAEEQLYRAIMATFNIQQLALEIKNLACDKLAKELADRYSKDAKLQSTVERALQSAEGRINVRLYKMLEEGITIKFKELK